MAPRKDPIMQVHKMLEDRGDVYLEEYGEITGRIVGGQLRRQWAMTTKNAGGFNPVTTEHWFYYNQLFIVVERRADKDGRLTKHLEALAAEVGRLGIWFILVDPADPFDAVIDRLGPVPENFREFLTRVPK